MEILKQGLSGGGGGESYRQYRSHLLCDILFPIPKEYRTLRPLTVSLLLQAAEEFKQRGVALAEELSSKEASR